MVAGVATPRVRAGTVYARPCPRVFRKAQTIHPDLDATRRAVCLLHSQRCQTHTHTRARARAEPRVNLTYQTNHMPF